MAVTDFDAAFGGDFDKYFDALDEKNDKIKKEKVKENKGLLGKVVVTSANVATIAMVLRLGYNLMQLTAIGLRSDFTVLQHGLSYVGPAVLEALVLRVSAPITVSNSPYLSAKWEGIKEAVADVLPEKKSK